MTCRWKTCVPRDAPPSAARRILNEIRGDSRPGSCLWRVGLFQLLSSPLWCSGSSWEPQSCLTHLPNHTCAQGPATRTVCQVPRFGGVKKSALVGTRLCYTGKWTVLVSLVVSHLARRDLGLPEACLLALQSVVVWVWFEHHGSMKSP